MELIVAIVERGKGNGVAKAAAEAGAGGATIYPARGAGEHTISFFGNLKVDPGKEVVWILTDDDKANAIFEAVSAAAQTDKKGRGFAFTVPVRRVAGLDKNKDD